MFPSQLYKVLLSVRNVILLLFVLITFPLSAQRIENVRFEQKGKMIHIYYDLTGSGPSDIFTIEIYCSTDGGSTWGNPLNKVTGNVGPDQTTGKGRRIIWDVLAEKNKLEGNIMFEIRLMISDMNSGKLVDSRDEHVYKWIRIGSQVWMEENMSYLPFVSPSSEESKSTPYYYVYGYKGAGTNVVGAKATANYSIYGVLYNWPAAKKACPIGWHLPSNAEWDELISYLGGGDVAGGDLKESGTNHWGSPNLGATNSSGFTALPGGYRYNYKDFSGLGLYGAWWSATEHNEASAWRYYLRYTIKDVSHNIYKKENGFSVRCVKDY